MNRERQEQLNRLAGKLPLAPIESVLRLAASELRHLAEVEQERDAALAKLSEYEAAMLILDGRLGNNPNSVLLACQEYIAAEDELPNRFDTEDYSLSKAIKELAASDLKLSQFEDAMQRDRSPAWEKQLKYLATELRSASEYPNASPKYISREKLRMAAVKLEEMATVYTHKCNFVTCKLALNEAKLLLENIHASGGVFGGVVRLGDFEMVKVVLANITATLQSLEATEP